MKVVVKNNFVGVVAEKPWQAMQAAEKLHGDVDARHARLSPQRDAYQQIRKEPSTRHAARRLGRRGRQRSRRRRRSCESTYHHPYQMHGSIGSSCAVADVQADKATLWSATQSAYPTRNTTADDARAEAGDACA